MNILIVEDEMIVARGIKATLKKINANVVEICENGMKALDFLNSGWNDIDIVITDIKMPVLSGNEFIKLAVENFPKLKFVVLSGYGEFELAQEVMKYGVKHYLLKPYSAEKLFDAIRSLEEDILKEAELVSKISEKKTEEYEVGNKNNIVSQIIEYIDENLHDEELSLSKISRDKVFLNVTYMGRIFHKEVGMSFPKYVTNKRIELAKNLIKASDNELIYEISEKVGFGSNSQYFSQVFKKITGYTPTEYKNFVRKKGV